MWNFSSTQQTMGIESQTKIVVNGLYLKVSEKLGSIPNHG
jgi:hypothetical protein